MGRGHEDGSCTRKEVNAKGWVDGPPLPLPLPCLCHRSCCGSQACHHLKKIPTFFLFSQNCLITLPILLVFLLPRSMQKGGWMDHPYLCLSPVFVIGAAVAFKLASV